MAFDLFLAENTLEDDAYLRFYKWDPFCLSIGRFQDESIVNKEALAADGYDWVKRPTGGRAIFHAAEITYSVILKLRMNMSPQSLYRQINEAIFLGLKNFHPILGNVLFESDQPNFSELYKQGRGTACFSTPAKSELKFKNKKIVGSAQRKIKDTILQQGSILCGSLHKQITNYLHLTAEEHDRLSNELDERTTDIATETVQVVDYDFLVTCLQNGFEKQFDSTIKGDDQLIIDFFEKSPSRFYKQLIL